MFSLLCLNVHDPRTNYKFLHSFFSQLDTIFEHPFFFFLMFSFFWWVSIQRFYIPASRFQFLLFYSYDKITCPISSVPLGLGHNIGYKNTSALLAKL